METLNKCLQSLHSATCDSEKLAILHVIAKVAPSQKLQPSYVNSLFEAISADFILRLFKSNQSADSERYISIALRICSIFFQTNCSLIKSSSHLLSAIFDIVGHLKSEMLSETLELLLLIASVSEGCESLVKTKCFMHLGDFIKNDKESNKVISIFVKILEASDNFPEDADELMCDLAKSFASAQDLNKFYCLHALNELVRSASHFALDYRKKSVDIFGDVVKGCREILQSRVKQEFKQTAIGLLSNLTKIFGGEFLFDLRINSDEKFIALVLTVTALELSFINNQPFESENEVITSACELTHNILLAIFSDCFESSHLASDSGFISNLLHCLNNLISCIFFYLKQIKNKEIDVAHCSTMVAASSLICIWATEDTENLRDDLVETQPTIFEVVKIYFKKFSLKSNAIHDGKLMDLFVVYASQNIQNTRLKLFQPKYFSFIVEYFEHLLYTNIINFQSIEFALHLLNIYTLVYPELSAVHKDLPRLLLVLLDKEEFIVSSELSYYSKVEGASIAIFVLVLNGEKNKFSERTYELALKILCLNDANVSDIWIILLQRLIELYPKCSILKKILRNFRNLLVEKLKDVSDAQDVLASLKSLWPGNQP